MSRLFIPGAPFTAGDLEMRLLEQVVPPGFDCGSEEQNAFLYDRAWADMQRGISVTHLLFATGTLAAFVTLMSDRIQLGPREKPRGVSYRLVPAVKIAQLGIDRRSAGYGLGKWSDTPSKPLASCARSWAVAT
jgi:hypothetical protein